MADFACKDETTILVTGSSRGLGRGLVEYYAERGWRVFGCSRSESDFIHARYHHIVTDISSEEGVRVIFKKLSKDSIKPTVLINNAGIKSDSHALLATLKQAEEMISSNFIGAFLVMRETSKLMKRAHFGRIINISSIAVPLADVGSGLYAATKAAVEQFSRSLSREFGQDDITVNTLGISVYQDSAMVRQLDSDILARAQENLMKPSALTIGEICHAIDFFASSKARNISGQTVYFGGVR